MIDPRILENEKRLHIALKEKLRADDPEIDERTLADTVEGLTDFHDTLAAIVRSLFDDKIMMEGLDARIDEMVKRRNRYENRIKSRRNLVCDTMIEADLANLTMPDFTASVRKAPRHVVIVDEAIIPREFIEIVEHRKVLKDKINKAITNGEQVEGAALSNQGMMLNVRTR